MLLRFKIYDSFIAKLNIYFIKLIVTLKMTLFPLNRNFPAFFSIVKENYWEIQKT